MPARKRSHPRGGPGGLVEVASLTDAVRFTCRKPKGFETFALAAEVARAGNDARALAWLAALNADPATTCAKSPAEVASGRALTAPVAPR